MTQKLEIIKFLLDNKIHLYDLSSDNSLSFVNRSSFAEQFFKPLGLMNEKTIVRNASEVSPRHLFYYLYKNKDISKEKKETIIRKLMTIVDFNSVDIISTIIKMRDQDLMEYYIINEGS